MYRKYTLIYTVIWRLWYIACVHCSVVHIYHTLWLYTAVYSPYGSKSYGFIIHNCVFRKYSVNYYSSWIMKCCPPFLENFPKQREHYRMYVNNERWTSFFFILIWKNNSVSWHSDGYLLTSIYYAESNCIRTNKLTIKTWFFVAHAKNNYCVHLPYTFVYNTTAVCNIYFLHRMARK